MNRDDLTPEEHELLCSLEDHELVSLIVAFTVRALNDELSRVHGDKLYLMAATVLLTAAPGDLVKTFPGHRQRWEHN